MRKGNEQIVSKLKEAAAIDASVEEMCFYAGISRATFYRWMEENSELKDEIEALRNKPVLKARQTIVTALDQPSVAMAYLSKKRPQEFAEKSKVEHSGSVSVSEAPVTPEQKEIVDKFEGELRNTLTKKKT